jgi:hypothetical protein
MGLRGACPKVAELRSDLALALRLITKFDDQVLDLAALVEDMAAEADIM